MKVFTEKETPVQNLAFCAIVAALDGLLSLLGALLPFSAFVTMLIAPLLASLVAYFCKKRYYAVYFFASLGVSLAVSFWNYQNTVFYLLPSLCAGLAYGFLLHLKAPFPLTNLAVALIQYAFFILSLYLVKALCEVDMRDVLKSIFSLKDSSLLESAFPLLGLAYSFAVTGLSHLFFSLQAKQFGIEAKEDNKHPWLYPSLALTFASLSFAFGFAIPKIAYFCLGLTFYMAFAGFLSRFPFSCWLGWVTLGITIFASILGFSFCYPKLEPEQGLLFLSFFPVSLSIATFVDVLLGKKNKPN